MTRKDSYHRSRAKAFRKRQKKRRGMPSKRDIFTESQRLNRKRRGLDADDVV